MFRRKDNSNHQHIWKVIKKDEFDSPMDRLIAAEATSISGYANFTRHVIYTLRCDVCTTEKLEKFEV